MNQLQQSLGASLNRSSPVQAFEHHPSRAEMPINYWKWMTCRDVHLFTFNNPFLFQLFNRRSFCEQFLQPVLDFTLIVIPITTWKDFQQASLPSKNHEKLFSKWANIQVASVNKLNPFYQTPEGEDEAELLLCKGRLHKKIQIWFPKVRLIELVGWH